jgi:NADH-quinone oxidoreductase subunit L
MNVNEFNLHLWLIPVLPFLGFLVNGLFGRHYSNRTVAAVGLLFPGASLAWALVIVARVFAAGAATVLPHTEAIGTWFRVGSFVVPYAFFLDQLSLVMMLVVTGVGFIIHVYSVGYMAHEGGYYRFFSYLNLFMFFMLTLVLANNYLLMFVGWEGVGLASYLLIGFFFLRNAAASAGKKAFITNRVGDFGFLIALFLLIKHFGSVEFSTVFSKVSGLPAEAAAGTLTAIGLLMLVGACGKSAQLPLYVWLPDAMEGPTPVSALIHAATMVTAGVYMVARSNPIFDRAPLALTAVAIVGALTAIFAATIGLVQNDIKRVLAYSTISQLGYMFLACGVMAYSAGIFHLVTHAFFKGLLFLAAGSVIHALGGEQDMRNMGGLRTKIPWTFWTMTAATFAIAGFFPFAGFFSKDEILWRVWSSPGRGSGILWAVGVFTAFLTSFYMFRLWFLTFFNEYRGGNGAGGGHAQPARAAGEPQDAFLEVEAPTIYHGLLAREFLRRRGTVLDMKKQEPVFTYFVRLPRSEAETFAQWLQHETKNAAWCRVREAVQAPEPHHEPHESPKVMLVPLVLLAILSVVGGWIGWPSALGGSNHFDKFLAPVVKVSVEAPPAAKAHGIAEPERTPGHGEESTEVLFSAISVGAAGLGLFLAWLCYVKYRELPERMSLAVHGFYTTLLNKYYVDEGYQALFIKPIVEGSTFLLWRAIDVGVIDGTVNGAAADARAASRAVRRMQSGNLRSYAGWIITGAVLMLAYMIWLGVH